VLSRLRHHQQRPPRPRRASDRGQASLEWLAVVALVSSLLALGAGLAEADAVGRRVTREMARALCIVRDGDCRRDQEPCALSQESDRSTWTVEVAFVRHKRERFALIERRSDGTYAVTTDSTVSLGAFGQVGAKANLRVHGVGFALGGAFMASSIAQLSKGRTWIVRSAAEAQAIADSGGSSRPPDLTSGALASEASIGVAASVSEPVDLQVAAAGLTFEKKAGTIVDHRTGKRTTYISADDATAEAHALVLGSWESRGAQEVYAIETSSTGRPLALTITTTDSLSGSRDLPTVVQPVAGRLPTAGADRYEVTAALDLTEPAALAAALDLLKAIKGRDSRERPSATLRRLVETSGTVEARLLASEKDETDSINGGITPGLGRLALDNSYVHHEERLLAATSRGLDGSWIVREDCG
jgi:hypothetical protein